MTAPVLPSTTALQWLVQIIRLGGQSVPIARLRTEIQLPTTQPGDPRVREWCWLDTGAPLSVIPFRAQTHGLIWRPLAGVRTIWAGQPCDVGHIDIWVPNLMTSAFRGPLSLLAKFPHRDPPGAPLPILLGLEFLITHQAAFTLDPPPQTGMLRIP